MQLSWLGALVSVMVLLRGPWLTLPADQTNQGGEPAATASIASPAAETQVLLTPECDPAAIASHRTATQARVVGAGAAGLRVRQGPGVEFRTHVILREGAVVRLLGPPSEGLGTSWLEITDLQGGQYRGWSSVAFLAPLSPCDALDGEAAPPPSIQGKVLSAKLTAYSYQEPGEGAHGWITRSGAPVTWGTVAVDPTVIPLGSRLAIEGFTDTFVAQDTGFGVRGAHVDIFFPDEEAAREFGLAQRDVMILVDP